MLFFFKDANIYIWHRDTGALLETLAGHGEGSVNSVAWNPRDERMFASCSDDHTVRIWEALPNDFVIDEETRAQHLISMENGNGKGKGKKRPSWDSDGVEI